MTPSRWSIFLPALALIAACGAAAAGAETVPFSSGRWEIRGAESRLEPYLGRESLYLKGGIAWLKDVELLNGVIEFDVAVTGERGFMGALWRLQDENNYEEFYIRPHMSGNPDANQYTPIYNGLAAWQLYHGEGYGAPVEYRNNAWMHIRIVISGGKGEVFIDSDEPVLFIREMKRAIRPGSLGVVCANFAYAHFANFTYTAMESPELLSAEAAEPPRPEAPGAVRSWMISGTFLESFLDGKHVLTATDTRDMDWTAATAEPTGILNLASIRSLSERGDTVFAKLVIRSERAQVKKISLGYSDRLRAWFNARLIYSGSRMYQSRDYRYLGTIGLFDDLYLPLREGENELWLAVSESFGGWGIMARLENIEGIALE